MIVIDKQLEHLGGKTGCSAMCISDARVFLSLTETHLLVTISGCNCDSTQIMAERLF
jgi:hypothetical protein